MPDHTIKGISNRGRYLLAQQENDVLDFKESIAGLTSDDLVAFANTRDGGAILLGVREGKGEDGMQAAEIRGCEIGDEPKMTILNKAASCMPPLEGVEVFFENTGERPFIRIEIPSGEHRPHCTASGTYKIREDGRNRAIHPRTLLGIFVEQEGDRFFGRFHQATDALREEISGLREEISNARDQLLPPGD